MASRRHQSCLSNEETINYSQRPHDTRGMTRMAYGIVGEKTYQTVEYVRDL